MNYIGIRRAREVLVWQLRLLVLMFLVGCIHLPLDSKYPGPKPLPESVELDFAYEKFSGEYLEIAEFKKSKNGLKGEVAGYYTIRRFELMPDHNTLSDDHNILIDFYDVAGDNKTPVIMCLPVLGGHNNQFANSFARYFAENGYAVVIVHRQDQYKDLRDVEKIEETLRQIVFDHRQVVDWIELQDELDSNNIGVFGISMGGIKGLLVSALEPRIKVSVIGLAGGNLPYILISSHESEIKKRIAALMQDLGLTQSEVLAKLQAEIQTDPLAYAPYIDARNMLLINAVFDRVIFPKAARELRRAMGKPERIYLFSGHYTAIGYIPYVKQEALEFFGKKFDH